MEQNLESINLAQLMSSPLPNSMLRKKRRKKKYETRGSVQRPLHDTLPYENPFFSNPEPDSMEGPPVVLSSSKDKKGRPQTMQFESSLDLEQSPSSSQGMPSPFQKLSDLSCVAQTFSESGQERIIVPKNLNLGPSFSLVSPLPPAQARPLSFMEDTTSLPLSALSPRGMPLQKKEKDLRLYFGVSSGGFSSPTTLSPERLSSVLQDQNHSLCRSILSVSNGTQATMRSIVSLHNQPDVLLLHCLEDELLSKGDLSVIAREQTPTVFALKECLSLFPSSVEHLLFGLLKFGESLTPKHLHLLCDSFSLNDIDLLSSQKESHQHQRSCKHHPGCKHSLKLRKRLQKETMKLLSAGSIPIELCVLCHRCTLLIEQTPNVQRDESIPIENWAVTAFLFLRFLVPMVTSSSQREKNGKGISFLSRFLMKLCCRSKFRISGCGGPDPRSNSQGSHLNGPSPSSTHPIRHRSKSSGTALSRTLQEKKLGERTGGRGGGGGGDGDGDGVSLVNLILADCFEAFDRFCSEIRERGRDFWGDQLHVEKTHFVAQVALLKEEWQKDLLGFIEKHKGLILAEAKKRDWEITSRLDFFCEEIQKVPPPHTPPQSPGSFFDSTLPVSRSFSAFSPTFSPLWSSSEESPKQQSPAFSFSFKKKPSKESTLSPTRTPPSSSKDTSPKTPPTLSAKTYKISPPVKSLPKKRTPPSFLPHHHRTPPHFPKVPDATSPSSSNHMSFSPPASPRISPNQHYVTRTQHTPPIRKSNHFLPEPVMSGEGTHGGSSPAK